MNNHCKSTNKVIKSVSSEDYFKENSSMDDSRTSSSYSDSNYNGNSNSQLREIFDGPHHPNKVFIPSSRPSLMSLVRISAH